jgi:exodeoxyribonuclease V alpha subunit
MFEQEVLELVTKNEQLGSLYVTVDYIIKGMEHKNLSTDAILDILMALISKKEIHVDSSFGTPYRVYKTETYIKEKFCSDILLKRKSEISSASYDSISMSDFKTLMQQRVDDEDGLLSSMELTALQKQAIVNSLVHPVSIITGYPGTGKTTCLRVLTNILKKNNINFLLLAPTGIAAKRLSNLTGAKASTVHRAFQAQGEIEDRDFSYVGIQKTVQESVTDQDSTWTWGIEGSHYPADIVIIDESSMLDTNLLYRILMYTKPLCRVVLIGDQEQLPSVGPGSVLKDLIASNAFPVTRFEEIFRQDGTSPIIVSAHDIVKGNFPSSVDGDFKFIEINDEQEILDKVLETVCNFYKNQLNFQVFSPKHAGLLGVTNLNSEIREKINSKSNKKKEFQIDKFSYVREGDRVMVIKNHYKNNLFNGDFGKVHLINFSKKSIEVKIFGDIPRIFSYKIEEFSKYFRLCYACTVHKAQGLEMDTIIFPIVRSHGFMLQRNLLYTAVTRAKKNVILIGQRAALLQAVQNNREDKRNTSLRERLGS